MADTLLCTVDARGVATLTLNRPELHNAFDDALIAALHEAFEALRGRDDVRVLVLAGAGKSFCAGADLNWMRRMGAADRAENEAGALRMADMFEALDTLPCVTVARVHGAAFAGATGLIAACDVAIAAEDSRFAISEVRVGIAPATIAPYVLAAMGPRAARRYWLTGERFDGIEAARVGLVHAAVPVAELDAAVEGVVAAALGNGPAALKACKALIRATAGPVTEETRRATAARIAALRATPEGREGIASFLEKRRPAWQETGA
ncbi:MAG: enoyl-CoA hydratase-related protein [Alphaproteobacteria bacterium]